MTQPCPVCDRPATRAHQPFCSQGCRDRDLLQWLNEGYRVPVAPHEDEGVDSDASPY